MNNNQLSKLIESLIYESLKTQKNKYGEDKINSIKDIDPSNSYKYIDQIQKFIYVDHADKTDVKKYIDIYNDKLNKNLVDVEHRNINKFKTFDDFEKYIDLIKNVKSNTSIKKQNRAIINDQYIKTIYTDHGKYAGTYNVYLPDTMEQSIELQSYNTKWCTQIPDKNENWFTTYRFDDNITIYYFINKDGYITMIDNHLHTTKYPQTIMFQISIDKHNKVIDIRDNADRELTESELYELSGIRQSDYKWKSLSDGHYDIDIKGKRSIFNYKNGKYDGEYIFYYTNGNIKIKQNYKDGKLNGEYIDYYDDGKIWTKQNYKNNKLESKYISYYESEHLHINQYYKNDKLDGEYIEYYENGYVYIKQYYKDGKLDGEYIKYRLNGKIKEIQHYKDNQLDGEYIEYYENGNIHLKQYYKDDKPNGEYVQYYKNSNINVKQYLKDGQRDGEYIEYDENGKIIEKSYYKNGIKIKGE